MKASILHDEHGEILAISKITDLTETGSKFTSARMWPGSGQWLIEVELSEDEQKLPLRELHSNHVVNVAASKLEKKGGQSES
jgi:hypothetical protein